MSKRLLSGALVTVGAMLAVAGAALARTNSGPLPSYGSIPASLTPARPSQTQQPVIPLPAQSTAPSSLPPSKMPRVQADHAPMRLRVPDVSIDAELVPAGVADGNLLLPEPRQAGWWIGGALPGDPGGTVVIAGHVDAADGSHGALYALTSLRRGATVQITTAVGPVNYTVTAMRHFAKQQLPRDLFTRSGGHRLVLITCGGDYSPDHGYSDNVVAYATPTHKG